MKEYFCYRNGQQPSARKQAQEVHVHMANAYLFYANQKHLYSCVYFSYLTCKQSVLEWGLSTPSNNYVEKVKHYFVSTEGNKRNHIKIMRWEVTQ